MSQVGRTTWLEIKIIVVKSGSYQRGPVGAWCVTCLVHWREMARWRRRGPAPSPTIHSFVINDLSVHAGKAVRGTREAHEAGGGGADYGSEG